MMRKFVHCIGEIPHQDHILTLSHHLTNSEGPAQHTHVGVDSHDDDVFDPALLHQVIGLGRIGDCVAFRDFEGLDLFFVETFRLADRFKVVAGLVGHHRHGRFMMRAEKAPTLQRNFRFNGGSLLSQFSLGSVFIDLHATARAMNNDKFGLLFSHLHGLPLHPFRIRSTVSQ